MHEYLHRHFYLDLLHNFPQMTCFQAQILTFFYSIYFHELFLTILWGETTFYLTALQVSQLLLFFAFAWAKGTFIGNFIFWFGQFSSITGILYLYGYDALNYTYIRGGV